MSLPRKRYRQYLEPGADRTKIPKSTYYRWKHAGRTIPGQIPERRDRGASPTLRSGSPTIHIPLDALDQNLGTQLNNESQDVSSSEARDLLQLNDESQDVLNSESQELLPQLVATDSSCITSESDGENFDYGNMIGEEADEIILTPSSISSIESGVNVFFPDEGNESFTNLTNDHETESVPSSGLLTPEILNERLVPSLSVTKFETLLMIFHLVMRHGMTGVFLEDMLKYTNTLVGEDNAIPSSKYLFHKLFMTGKKIDIHFYCPPCENYLGPSSAYNTGTVDCKKCKRVCSSTSMNEGNFFVSVSIQDQLNNFLKRKDVNIIYPVEQRPERTFSDIYDGAIYKALQEDCKNYNQEHPLTLTFNTDGSPVYKSCKNSLWPIQFILNEVDPKERFNVENTMVAGLWFGSQSPIMDIFLKPFVSELQILETSGVTWTLPNGSTIQSPVFAICCCTDSVAKPKVQKHHQFNGKYGCGYCLHPGVSTVVNETTGHTGLRYVANDNYPYRSDKSLRHDMKKASKLPKKAKEKHVFGSLGISPLSSLPLFNVVFGFGIDYMHAALEGVAVRLCDLWFSRNNNGQDFFIGDKIHLVDKRILSITPPSSCRGPRPISSRVHFKANEWRSFLNFYALPCLIDILPNIYYSHFKKLVTAVYTLLRGSFTYDEMQRADFLLYDFVWDFADLYGENNMVYNVHLLLHFGKTVSMLGPMWAYSAFTFESGNGRLVKLVKGTTGVSTQIARKYHMASTAKDLIVGKQYTVSNTVLAFCNDIVCYKELKNVSRFDNVTVFGNGGSIILTEDEIQIIRDYGVGPPQSRVVNFFNRAVKQGVMYHGKRYSKQERFDDSCVKLQDGSYAVVDLIFVENDGSASDVWCFCRVIRLPESNDDTRFPLHIKQACLDAVGPLRLFPFSFIEEKCLLMSCDEKVYVAEFPNQFEKD